MKLLVRLVATAAALFLATLVVPGVRIEASVRGYAIVLVVFGLVNLFVRPLARLISLPIRLLTLGLFGFVINALMFMLTDRIAGDALTIEGGFAAQLLRALAASVIVSVASTLIAWLIPGED